MRIRDLIPAVFLNLLICGAIHAQEQKLSERLTIQIDAKEKGKIFCDIGHATFIAPVGWNPHPSGKNTYVILTPENENTETLTKLISIDIGLTTTKTARETAEAFAKTWQGKLAEEPLKLNGEEAFRVLATADPDKVQPVDSIVIFHGGRAFLLMGGAKKKDAPSEALNEIVRTWKWK